MEIAFHREKEGFLSEEERNAIFQTMKVVVVQVSFFSKNGKRRIGGGFTLKDKGYIMTSWDVVESERNDEISIRHAKETKWLKVDVALSKRDLGVAILRVKDCQTRDWKYANMSEELDINVGAEVITIHHPDNLYYSLSIGHVMYQSKNVEAASNSYFGRAKPAENETPPIRFLGDIIHEVDMDKFIHLANNLPLIQINNVHDGDESSGSPIFNSLGRIVGMHLFHYKLLDFAVPTVVLKNCIRDFEGGQKKHFLKGESSSGQRK